MTDADLIEKVARLAGWEERKWGWFIKDNIFDIAMAAPDPEAMLTDSGALALIKELLGAGWELCSPDEETYMWEGDWHIIREETLEHSTCLAYCVAMEKP